MDLLPNRDTVAAFEARLGRPVMTALIWLLAGGLAVASVSVIIGGLRSGFTALGPFLPGAGWVDWTFRGAVALLLIGGFVAIIRRVQRLEATTSDRKAWNRLEERLDYIENKVGGRLQDVVVERMVDGGLPVPQPVTHSERQRLEIVRQLLRDAAQAAKSVEAAGGDLDKASNQAWLYMRILNVIAELLSFQRYKEFRDYEDGLRQKREQHQEKSDGRKHLIDMGDYLLKIADRLSFEDIDLRAKLPLSFADYLRRE
jgi:hypothetical protein